METDLMEKFKASEEVILSGDCGIDSPGFSADTRSWTTLLE